MMDDLRERVARINIITAELIDMKNNKADVHQAAKAAKKLIPGQAVQHITHPNMKGVVGTSVSETLQVAVTSPGNPHGAMFFADPRNLRLAALSATPIEALQQRVERLTEESLQFKRWWGQERERNARLQNKLDAARAALGDDG